MHTFFPDYISAVRTGVCAYMDATLLHSPILKDFFAGASTVLAEIMILSSQFLPLVEGFLVAEEPSHVIKRRIT